MNQINNLAMVIKEKGYLSAEGQNAFTELYEAIQKDIMAVVKRYVRSEEHKNLCLDEMELISLASYEGILNAVKDYDICKGDFLARYKSFIHYTLNNGLKKQMKQSQKSLSLAISIEQPSSKNKEILIKDILPDNQETFDDSEAEEILAAFASKSGKDKAQIIEILAFTDGQAERNEAFCSLFNVSEYSAAIRKKVSRVKAEFRDFCLEQGSFI